MAARVEICKKPLWLDPRNGNRPSQGARGGRSTPSNWNCVAARTILVVLFLAHSTFAQNNLARKNLTQDPQSEDDRTDTDPLKTERTWTDSTGKYKVVASFVAINDGVIELKKTSSGTVLKLPLERLSKTDQEVAQRLDAQRLDALGRAAVTRPKTAQKTPLKLTAQLKWSDLFDLENDQPVPTYLELHVTAKGPAAKDALEYGFLSLDTIVDQDDSALRLRKPASDFFDLSSKFVQVKGRGTGFFAKHPEDGVKCVFQLVRPDTPVTTIQSVKGSFQLKTGGTRNVVELNKAITSLGKVQSDQLDRWGVAAQISRPKADLLEVHVKNAKPENHLRVEVLDPDQKSLLDQNGVSERGTRRDRTFGFSFKRAVPANATVYISITSEMELRKVPFSFQDLKVPKSQ